MDLKKFGLFIAEEREKNGYSSQRQLALASGISNGTIARIEAGRQKPSPETLRTLSKFLGVNHAELMEKAGYLNNSTLYFRERYLDPYIKDKISEVTKWVFEETFRKHGYDATKLASDPEYFDSLPTHHRIDIMIDTLEAKVLDQALEPSEDDEIIVDREKGLVVLNSIRAGQKLMTLSEHIEHASASPGMAAEITSVKPELLQGKEGFALRVKDDSMSGDRIQAGDVVAVAKQDDVQPNEIAVVAIGGEEATLRRVKREGNMCMLIPSNPSMSPDLVPCKKITIIGKVVEVKFWPK